MSERNSPRGGAKRMDKERVIYRISAIKEHAHDLKEDIEKGIVMKQSYGLLLDWIDELEKLIKEG
jgi:hypothetical protein